MASGDPAENIKFRSESVLLMDKQEDNRKFLPDSSQRGVLAAWTPIGPAPIPNGQVQSGAQLPVSGELSPLRLIRPIRTLSISAQRRADFTARSTAARLDAAARQRFESGNRHDCHCASQPDTIYVGTGEPNLSSDSFFGAGIYRIDNASTASPTISAALENGSNFTGRGIGQNHCSPDNPATIFVASTSGVGGIGPATPAVLPNRGLYRSTDATSANPTFTQVAFPFGDQNLSVRDIAIDPNNANILIANVVANGGGVLTNDKRAFRRSDFYAGINFYRHEHEQSDRRICGDSSGGRYQRHVLCGSRQQYRRNRDWQNLEINGRRSDVHAD